MRFDDPLDWVPRDIKRTTGRPPTRWSDFFTKSLKENYDALRVSRERRNHWATLARDRDKWKNCLVPARPVRRSTGVKIVGNSVALPRCIQRFHFNPREPLRNRTRIWENDLYEMGQIETCDPHFVMRFLLTPAVRSAAFYVGSTLLCSLIGKVVVTRFFFDYPVVILMLQMATTLFIVELLRVLGIVKLSPYSFEKGRHCFLPSILYCVAQWLTLVAFEGIGLPGFESVKRFTPLVILLGSTAISRQSRLDHIQLIGVAGISFTSFLTVNFEISLDQYSIFYGLIAIVLQGAAYMQFESLSHTYQDEIRDAFMYMMTSAHPLFGGAFAVLLISSIFLQYATFSCIEQNGALNTQIISNVRAAFQIFIAYFLSLYLFYDVSPGFLNYIGLLCTGAAAYYLYNQRNSDSTLVKSAWASKA
ncbi:hypothetical protein RB195_000774 [Necator americanus]|uniref:UAA transporter family protein n=1 Tax=Necator americanus TaxID=51031 RepID=A0ABR1DC63_NECAM